MHHFYKRNYYDITITPPPPTQFVILKTPLFWAFQPQQKIYVARNNNLFLPSYLSIYGIITSCFVLGVII